MPTASYTFNFNAAGDVDALTDVGDDANLNSAWSTDGGGVWEWLQSTGAITANGERARSASFTWESKFGISPGKIITNIQCPAFDELFWATGGLSTRRVRIRLVDATTGVTVHAAGDLQDLAGTITPTTGAPQSRGAGTTRAVDTAKQASNTSLKLEVQVNFTGTLSAQVDIEQDKIQILVTWDDPLPTYPAIPAIGSVTPGNDWKKLGIYMFDLYAVNLGTSHSGAADRAEFLSWLYDNGVGWVACQCFDDEYTVPPDAPLRFQDVMGDWRDDIRALGMDFGLWGVQHNDPTGDAARALSQIALWEPDFYIADAESSYKTDTGGTRAHSATFVNAFRAGAPSIKAALTSYGAASGLNVFGDTQNAAASVFDYKSWYDAGFHFHPQAYSNQLTPDYDPLQCVRHAKRANWPLSRVEVIIGIWNSSRVFSGAEYVGKMREKHDELGGLRAVQPETSFGFSMFLGEDLYEQDLIDLGRGAFYENLVERRDKAPTYGDVVYAK